MHHQVHCFYHTKSCLVVVVNFFILTFLTPSVIPQWDGVGSNIVDKMMQQHNPTISESTVTNAENVMSNLLVNNVKTVFYNFFFSQLLSL